MELKLTIVAVFSSLLLAIIVIDLVRRKKLKEEYSILWIGASLFFIVLSTWSSSIELLAGLLGVAYPPSALFVMLIYVVMLFLLHVTIVLTKLSEQNKTLIQRIAILENTIDQLKESTEKS